MLRYVTLRYVTTLTLTTSSPSTTTTPTTTRYLQTRILPRYASAEGAQGRMREHIISLICIAFCNPYAPADAGAVGEH